MHTLILIHNGSFDLFRNMVRVFGLKWKRKKQMKRGKKRISHLHWRGNWWKLVNNPLSTFHIHIHTVRSMRMGERVFEFIIILLFFSLSLALRQWMTTIKRNIHVRNFTIESNRIYILFLSHLDSSGCFVLFFFFFLFLFSVLLSDFFFLLDRFIFMLLQVTNC